MNRMDKFITQQAKRLAKKLGPRPSELIKDWSIFPGDKVVITQGPDRGFVGCVSQIERDFNRLTVAGANIMRKPIPHSDNKYFSDKEYPVPYQYVALIDPEFQQPTQVRWEAQKRVSLLSGKELPIPREDLSRRPEGPFDTTQKSYETVSYKPDIRVPPLPADCVLP